MAPQPLQFLGKALFQFAPGIRRCEDRQDFVGREDLPEAVAAHGEPPAFRQVPALDLRLRPVLATDLREELVLIRMGGELLLGDDAAQHIQLGDGVVQRAPDEPRTGELHDAAVADMDGGNFRAAPQ